MNSNPLNVLEEAFNGIGQSMISEEFAYKILAFLNTWGSGNAIVVGKMFPMISLAQKKFNMKAGCIPTLNPEKLKDYSLEWKKGEKCVYLKEFIDRSGKNVALGMKKT